MRRAALVLDRRRAASRWPFRSPSRRLPTHRRRHPGAIPICRRSGRATRPSASRCSGPAALGTKAELTDAEFAEKVTRDERTRRTAENAVGSFRNDNSWLTRSFRQTSLIVDPADGRAPRARGRRRGAPHAARHLRQRPVQRPEDFTLYDRCVTLGVVGSMTPKIYGNGYRIVQAPGYAVIMAEMIHEARVIPLDGRPHVGAGVRCYLGDSRGHWEGNTLVIETTNFNGKATVPGNPVLASTELKIVERITRVEADLLRYEATIIDPKTYTKPFTISIPFTSPPGYQVLPYECHEGNLGDPAGARRRAGRGPRARGGSQEGHHPSAAADSGRPHGWRPADHPRAARLEPLGSGPQGPYETSHDCCRHRPRAGVLVAPARAQAPDGAAVFEKACASCHLNPAADSRAPNRAALPQLAPETILTALTTGNMFRQGSALTDAERRAVAAFLAGRPVGTAAPLPTRAAAPPRRRRCERAICRRGWNGWGAGAANTRYSAGRGRRRDRADDAALEVEVGVRVPRRQLGAVAAGGAGRPRVRRQRERRHVRARREDRLHALELSRAGGHPHGALGRPVQARERPGRVRGVLCRRQRVGLRGGRRHGQGDLDRARSTRIPTRRPPGR